MFTNDQKSRSTRPRSTISDNKHRSIKGYVEKKKTKNLKDISD
jgi:hypothetical protein